MSIPEQNLARQLSQLGITPPKTEYMFWPYRMWRADFAWVKLRLLVEIEGGLFHNSTGAGAGRHLQGAGFREDAQKYNTASLLGYRILRFTPDDVESLEAVEQIMWATNQPPPLPIDVTQVLLCGYPTFEHGLQTRNKSQLKRLWEMIGDGTLLVSDKFANLVYQAGVKLDLWTLSDDMHMLDRIVGTFAGPAQ